MLQPKGFLITPCNTEINGIRGDFLFRLFSWQSAFLSPIDMLENEYIQRSAYVLCLLKRFLILSSFVCLFTLNTIKL